VKDFAKILGGAAFVAIVANLGAVVALGKALLMVGAYYVGAGIAAAAAGAKAAIAWLIAAAPVVAMIALGALLALVIDDIWTALTGGDSVVGRLWFELKELFGTLPTWAQTAIAMVVAEFANMWNTIKEFGATTIKWWSDKLGSILSFMGKSLDAPDGRAARSLSALSSAGKGLAGEPLIGGGATSPAASVAAAPAPGVTVAAPSIKQEIIVQAGDNSTGKEIAGHVVDQSRRWYEADLNASLVAVTQ
jgi:hypothetical protein